MSGTSPRDGRPDPKPAAPKPAAPKPAAPKPAAPERRKDDTDLGWGEGPAPQERQDPHEQWLLEQRPPHWD